MEYTKPALDVIANAVTLIQGEKSEGLADSPPQPIHTTAAYEVDE
jgi:hypothetical protein